MQVIDAGDFELERRLDSFARFRLSPDLQAAARIRARVMREARLQFDASRIAAHVAPALARASRRSLPGRLAMPFLAAAVWLGIGVGSISAAQAGGPLYPTRMWIENATLPTEPTARTAVELGRLDSRLAEAMAAAAEGDAGAVAAALDAYRLIADEASSSAAGDPALQEVVAGALDQHRVVLTAVARRLEDKGNSTAAGAVESSIRRAIDHNQDVIDRLDAAKGTGSSGTGGNDASSPVGGAGAGGGKPAITPRPTPDKIDRPDKPEKPDQTPRGGPDD